ncbi:MAG: VWA domain-containing protein, partial [Deltaproteobacteria bacterium]
QPPTYAFDLNVSVAAGMPIRALASPSHAIRTAWGPGRREARVQLDPSEALGGNRDFVLRYRLADADLASGMLLYDGGDERFFLMTVQPPPRPPADMVPPREYVFIVDVSGSMSGFPLDTAKALMRDLVAGLRPTDQFDVVLFAGASSVYSDVSVPAARDRIADALAWIDRQGAGGGTELLPALQTAFDLPQPRAGVARTFVVITDGYIAEEPEVFDTIRRRAGDANVFAFGIGDGVNRHLIEGIARAGRGEPFVVDYPGSATAAAARFRDYVAAPVLTDIEIAFDGFDAYDVEPIAPPDVFAQRPLVVFGKWRGTPRGTIRVTGVSGRGRFVDTLDVGQFTPDPRNRALALLWARDRIARLSDYATGDAHRDEVLALGLRYNLLTKYTSFVAVHHVVRAAQAAVPVDQPLPLPAGVSDTAIGVGSEPPLAPLLAALALAAAFVAARRRREAP